MRSGPPLRKPIRRRLFDTADVITINTSHAGVPFIRGDIRKRSFGVIVFSQTSLESFVVEHNIKTSEELQNNISELCNSLLVCSVRKRYGFAFLDIICDKYELGDIPKLVPCLTENERDMISRMSMSEIRAHMRLSDRLPYCRDYNHALTKLDKVRDFIGTTASNMEEVRPWEFPKGHRNPYEDTIVAALRELREETTIESLRVRIMAKSPIVYTYEGTNHQLYTVSYYIGLYDDRDQVEVVEPSTTERTYYRVKKSPLRLSKDSNSQGFRRPERSLSMPNRMFTLGENNEIDTVEWLTLDSIKSKMKAGLVDCYLSAVSSLIKSPLMMEILDGEQA